MGRKQAGEYSSDWSPPGYRVDERGKIEGGYAPREPQQLGALGRRGSTGHAESDRPGRAGRRRSTRPQRQGVLAGAPDRRLGAALPEPPGAAAPVVDDRLGHGRREPVPRAHARPPVERRHAADSHAGLDAVGRASAHHVRGLDVQRLVGGERRPRTPAGASSGSRTTARALSVAASSSTRPASRVSTGAPTARSSASTCSRPALPRPARRSAAVTSSSSAPATSRSGGSSGRTTAPPTTSSPRPD